MREVDVVLLSVLLTMDASNAAVVVVVEAV